MTTAPRVRQVGVDLQDSEENRALVDAIEEDNPDANITRMPGLVKIQVAGHTDNTGSAAHNMKLSEARARSVMNYLISKGVGPAMLSEKGYGKNEPVADNKTAEGRAKNRRVGLRRVE